MASTRTLISASLLALTAGCTVGPNYQRPALTAPAAYKEAAGWKPAAPNDAVLRGPWWETFQDPVLNGLEAQVAISNQSLLQAAANYEEARQLARADRAGYFPSISADGSAERELSPSSASAVTEPGRITTYSASLQGSWEPDLWGKLRRTTEADVTAAQASAADLAAARLSTQATLAQDYIALRALDEKKHLLDNSVNDYQRSLDITQNKYSVGVAARSDVILAESEVDATRAAAIDVGVQRAQYEHAIAVLIGRAPSALNLASRPALGLVLPAIPAQMPSDLLERRPDVAAAERAAASANAKVGVQTAAYFPDLSLSATGGYEGSPLDRLFSAPFRFWTLGANASETLLDFGQRRADVLGARAAYDASAAGYRQTVLGAFQQVEDNLSGLRILAQEGQVEDTAVAEAAQASVITLNEYKAGTVDYTAVVTAQVNELTDREQALTILQTRLTDAVALIEALGGGWNASDLPTSHQVLTRHSADAASVAATQ